MAAKISFQHDYDTRIDPKIKRLIKEYGLEGYGIFWCIIEDLYANDNVLAYDAVSIAKDLNTTVDKVEGIITKFSLFTFFDDTFSSTSIEKRLSKVKKKKPVLMGDILGVNDENKYTEEERLRFTKFKDWINEVAPQVNKMEQPFTISQFMQIIKEVDSEKMVELIKQMGNYKPLLQKNKSAYLTFTNWYNKNFNND